MLYQIFDFFFKSDQDGALFFKESQEGLEVQFIMVLVRQSLTLLVGTGKEFSQFVTTPMIHGLGGGGVKLYHAPHVVYTPFLIERKSVALLFFWGRAWVNFRPELSTIKNC